MRGLTAFIVATLLCMVVFTSCEDNRQYYVKNIGSNGSTPTMRDSDVHALISNNGFTQFLIDTEIWEIYDTESPRRWFFPNEVGLKQLDSAQNVVGTLRCDSATNYPDQRLWRLDGRIVGVNVEKDSFLTNQLFWDQSMHKLYSDSFIRIVKSDRIIEGYGFESNERLTAYEVKNPTGIFPISEQPGQGSQSQSPDVEDSDERTRVPRSDLQRASERDNYMPTSLPNARPIRLDRPTRINPQ